MKKALFPLVIILSACSGGHDSGGGDGDGGAYEVPVSDETIEEFCDDYAAVICENERSCCSEGGDEDCEFLQGIGCVIDIQFATNHYDLQFHLASAQAYKDNIAARGQDCHSYPVSLEYSVDKPVERQIGDVCPNPGGYWEYPSGCVNSYCAYDDEAREYLCTAFKAIGDACDEDEECGPGAACPYVSYGTEQFCAPTVGEGESCADDECAVGLWCEWDLDVCVPTDQAAGASCTDDNDCDGFCDEVTNTCAACTTDDDCSGECWDGTCAPHLPGDQDRIDEYYCIDSF